ncbi:hypothetical protein PROFUN_16676 [Planoprotostelium fungivorum]|uniref:Uncharacterized protein n=1 Tax=Planoprotostelium fungivorum TaxID=1890364 RepID=A0A2P6MP43_9EUKA|nr:hypothetical protein PROFUN_16676 [Planoprotostelium fungivorum]
MSLINYGVLWNRDHTMVFYPLGDHFSRNQVQAPRVRREPLEDVDRIFIQYSESHNRSWVRILFIIPTARDLTQALLKGPYFKPSPSEFRPYHPVATSNIRKMPYTATHPNRGLLNGLIQQHRINGYNTTFRGEAADRILTDTTVSDAKIDVWYADAQAAKTDADWEGLRDAIVPPPAQTAPTSRKLEKNYTWLSEGVSQMDPLLNLREDTCKKIKQRMTQVPVLLIEGPPYSGKTSLVSILTMYFKSHNYDCDSFSFLAGGALWDPSKYPDDSIVIVNEVQKLYHNKGDPFWEWIKRNKTERGTHRILLFAAWGGENLRGERFFLQDILMTQNECNNTYNKFTNWSGAPLTKDAYEFLINTTNRHIGYTRFVLGTIHNRFLHHEKTIGQSQILEIISSPLEAASLAYEVRLPLLEDIQRFYKVLLPVIRDVSVPYSLEWKDLIKTGLLSTFINKEGEQICQFSSSFVRSIYISLLCKTTTIKWVIWNPSQRRIESLIPEILYHVDIIEIQRRHAEGKLSEYVWQFEFYRCAHAVLRGEHRVSSEYQIDKPVAVGEKRGRGSPPRLDFWINGNLKFGFELLVDGIGQGKHVSRFEKGGRDNNIYCVYNEYIRGYLLSISGRKKITSWAVIDFRATDPAYQSRDCPIIWVRHDLTAGQLAVTQYAGQDNLLLHAQVTPGKECKIIKMHALPIPEL